MLLLELLEAIQLDPVTGLPYKVKNNLKELGIDELPTNITYQQRNKSGSARASAYAGSFRASAYDETGSQTGRTRKHFPIPFNASKEEVRKILTQAMTWQQQNDKYVRRQVRNSLRNTHGSSNPYEVATARAGTQKFENHPGITINAYPGNNPIFTHFFKVKTRDANNKIYVKQFPIKDMDDPQSVEQAFELAKKWYDEHYILPTKYYSRMIGVFYYITEGTWVAMFSPKMEEEDSESENLTRGNIVKKHFSVKEKGWDEAWRMACKARYHFMKGKQKMPDLNNPPSKEDVLAALEKKKSAKVSTS
jgi:hypothetical protein